MADWFYAKRYGYGASLPCSWQGWVAMALFLGLMIANGVLFGEDNLALFIALTAMIVPVFLFIVRRTTRGGWKWRWGKDEDTI